MSEGQPWHFEVMGRATLCWCFSQHVGWQLRGSRARASSGPPSGAWWSCAGLHWLLVGRVQTPVKKKKKGTKLHQEITEEITMKYVSAAQLSYIWISMASGPTERLQVIQLTVMVAEM